MKAKPFNAETADDYDRWWQGEKGRRAAKESVEKDRQESLQNLAGPGIVEIVFPPNRQAHTYQGPYHMAPDGNFSNPLSQEQQIDVKNVLLLSKEALNEKLTAINRWDKKDKEFFIEYFGNDKKQTREIIKDRIVRSIAQIDLFLKDDDYKTHFYGLPLKPDVFARTFPKIDGNENIYLGANFWTIQTSGNGNDTKVGTIIHEISHFKHIGNTTDWVNPAVSDIKVYGRKAALTWAFIGSRIGAGIKWAANFEYYIISK